MFITSIVLTTCCHSPLIVCLSPLEDDTHESMDLFPSQNVPDIVDAQLTFIELLNEPSSSLVSFEHAQNV